MIFFLIYKGWDFIFFHYMFVIKLSSFSSLAFVCQSFCCVDSFSNLHVGEEVGRPWIAVCGCSRGGWRYRTGLSSIRHCHGGNQPRLCHSWSYHECEQCKTWTWFSKDSWKWPYLFDPCFPTLSSTNNVQFSCQDYVILIIKTNLLFRPRTVL